MADLFNNNIVPNLKSVTASAQEAVSSVPTSAYFGNAARATLDNQFRVESALASVSVGDDVRYASRTLGSILNVDPTTNTMIARKKSIVTLSRGGTVSIFVSQAA